MAIKRFLCHLAASGRHLNKNANDWTRLSAVRLPPSMLATPKPIRAWSLTSLREKLIKIGAKRVSHGPVRCLPDGRVAVPKMLFARYCG
jgi:hypothetical protein